MSLIAVSPLSGWETVGPLLSASGLDLVAIKWLCSYWELWTAPLFVFHKNFPQFQDWGHLVFGHFPRVAAQYSG